MAEFPSFLRLRKIGPEIRAHYLSCQLQFFGAFTKQKERTHGSLTLVNSWPENAINRSGRIFFQFCSFSTLEQKLYSFEHNGSFNRLQSPIVSKKGIFHEKRWETRYLRAWQKGSSKMVMGPNCTFADF